MGGQDELSSVEAVNNDVDDECLIGYMMENNLIRDDWDLNLCKGDDLQNKDKRIIHGVIKKCRPLITTLKQSSILSSHLNQLRREMEIQRGLPSDCETRWNRYILSRQFLHHLQKLDHQIFWRKAFNRHTTCFIRTTHLH